MECLRLRVQTIVLVVSGKGTTAGLVRRKSNQVGVDGALKSQRRGLRTNLLHHSRGRPLCDTPRFGDTKRGLAPC